GPDDPARRVEQEEPLPVEAVDPGEKRRECAQDCDEAAEKNNLAAVLHEQILAELQPTFVEPHIATVSIGDRKAKFAADPIAAIVAEDRSGCGGADHAVEMKLSFAGQNRGRDEHGFA